MAIPAPQREVLKAEIAANVINTVLLIRYPHVRNRAAGAYNLPAAEVTALIADGVDYAEELIVAVETP